MIAVHSIQYRATFAMLPGLVPPSTSDASPSHGIIISCITYLHTAGTSPKSPFGTRNYRIRAAYAYRHIHLHIFVSAPLYSVHNSSSAVHTFAFATTALAAADQPQPTILDLSHPTVHLHRTTLNRSLAFAREPQREI